MGEDYISTHATDIVRNTIEKCKDNNIDLPEMIRVNAANLVACQSRGYNHILIDNFYEINLDTPFRQECSDKYKSP